MRVFRQANEYGDGGQPRRIAFGGISVGETIAKEVLCVAQPVAVEAAVLASEEETRKQGDVLDAWRRDLERHAMRRSVPRGSTTLRIRNRLVADELERRWNQAL
jgi:hypothetical protein